MMTTARKRTQCETMKRSMRLPLVLELNLRLELFRQECLRSGHCDGTAGVEAGNEPAFFGHSIGHQWLADELRVAESNVDPRLCFVTDDRRSRHDESTHLLSRSFEECDHTRLGSQIQGVRFQQEHEPLAGCLRVCSPCRSKVSGVR